MRSSHDKGYQDKGHNPDSHAPCKIEMYWTKKLPHRQAVVSAARESPHAENECGSQRPGSTCHKCAMNGPSRHSRRQGGSQRSVGNLRLLPAKVARKASAKDARVAGRERASPARLRSHKRRRLRFLSLALLQLLASLSFAAAP